LQKSKGNSADSEGLTVCIRYMEWTGNLNVFIFQRKMDKYHSLTVINAGKASLGQER
jgi:hypothetical protein